MKTDSEILRKLGGLASAELGDSPSRSGRRPMRAAMIRLAQRRRATLRRLAAVAAVLLVAATTFFCLEHWVPRPMTFWVGRTRTAGRSGDWVQAPADRRLDVAFEDGTRMQLDRRSAGRVLAGDRKRVRMVLDRGRVQAEVRKNTGSRWVVEAGPYSVTALGTRFSVAWAAGESSLDVAVTRGVVRVDGPDLPAAGAELRAGQKLHLGEAASSKPVIAARADTPAHKPAPVPAARPVLPATASQAEPVPTAPEQPEPVDHTKVAGLERLEPDSWQELSVLGRHAEAVALAERSGIDQLVASLPADDLWLLVESARIAHRGDVTVRALMAVRRRFAGTTRATTAAFLLGRAALELNHDPSSAVDWFQVYLNDAPNGTLAEEALGRQIDACRRAGQDERARRAARDYLRRYQQGVFAVQARKALEP